MATIAVPTIEQLAPIDILGHLVDRVQADQIKTDSFRFQTALKHLRIAQVWLRRDPDYGEPITPAERGD